MRIAVVIPALDEERIIEETLRRAAQHADLLVVADGGSHDATATRAAAVPGVRVVSSPPGRGVQLNAGAEAAIADGAEVLLFLHADTRLPDDARSWIENAVEEGGVGGGFEVRFADPRRVFRWGERLVNLRTRRLSLPLGDQAQFATVADFEALGGFQAWPILEDLDFVRRLRRRGGLAISPSPVVTAARRFAERGIVRTIATNWLIWALYLSGVRPERLAGLYPPR